MRHLIFTLDNKYPYILKVPRETLNHHTIFFEYDHFEMTRQFTIFERLVLKKFGFVGLVNGRNDRERRRI